MALLLLLWAAVVGTSGLTVAARDREAREAQDEQFMVRTELAGQILGNEVARIHGEQGAWAAAILSAENVAQSELQLACNGLGFESCGLFDADAALLMNAPHFPELLGRKFLFLDQVREPLETNEPSAAPVNISPALNTPVVALGVPFDTGFGRRVFTGLFTVQGGVIANRLNRAIDLPEHQIFVVDRNGNVASRWPGDLEPEVVPLARLDRELGTAVDSATSGEYVDRYFATADVPATHWGLVATVPTSVLYSPVREVTESAWRLVAGIALFGLVIVALTTRAARRRHELSEELRRLAVRHADHESRQRHAREVNDAIVQSLVAAEMAYDLGEMDESRRLVGEASRSARRWIGEQLRDVGDVVPGSLVRATAPDREPVRVR